jgi:hypothetical protein
VARCVVRYARERLHQPGNQRLQRECKSLSAGAPASTKACIPPLIGWTNYVLPPT